jgi:hypothetical protein
LIPAPDKFTFNAATLLSAACCIPAILLCISKWIKILELNWNRMFGNEESLEMMKGNATVKFIRKYAIAVLYGGVVLAIIEIGKRNIIVIGERNLFSPQVDYQTTFCSPDDAGAADSARTWPKARQRKLGEVGMKWLDET